MLPDSKNMLGNMLMELRDNYLKEKLFFIDGSGLEKFWNKIKTVYILISINIFFFNKKLWRLWLF